MKADNLVTLCHGCHRETESETRHGRHLSDNPEHLSHMGQTGQSGRELVTDERRQRIRVYVSDKSVIGRLADTGETQADVVRDLLNGEVPQEQIDAARTLAQTADHEDTNGETQSTS